MKWIFIASFVFLLAFTPAYIFNALVMPQLNSLHGTYSNADTIAQDAVNGAQR